jgi:hypothetical protein
VAVVKQLLFNMVLIISKISNYFSSVSNFIVIFKRVVIEISSMSTASVKNEDMAACSL